MHQGYVVHLFRLGDGDDPPVWWYSEGMRMDRLRLAAPTFGQYLLETVEFDLAFKERLAEH
jgi:hypothetical protein